MQAEARGVSRQRRGLCAGGGMGCVYLQDWGLCGRKGGPCVRGKVGCVYEGVQTHPKLKHQPMFHGPRVHPYNVASVSTATVTL